MCWNYEEIKNQFNNEAKRLGEYRVEVRPKAQADDIHKEIYDETLAGWSVYLSLRSSESLRSREALLEELKSMLTQQISGFDPFDEKQFLMWRGNTIKSLIAEFKEES